MIEILNYRNALPLDSMLLEYRLESVLGAGGFGMTYLAYDTVLEKKVAIKEYLPVELAVRAPNGGIVPVNSGSDYNYKWGLERFLQEARLLAKFSHPNIVSVLRFFEANGTAYMVMPLYRGRTLRDAARFQVHEIAEDLEDAGPDGNVGTREGTAGTIEALMLVAHDRGDIFEARNFFQQVGTEGWDLIEEALLGGGQRDAIPRFLEDDMRNGDAPDLAERRGEIEFPRHFII